MKRYLIIYSGIVQGVGFRYTLAMTAKKYGLTGNCKNLSNGNVRCEIQGNDIDSFLKETLQPQRFIQIDDYVIKEIPVDPKEKKFSVEYYSSW